MAVVDNDQPPPPELVLGWWCNQYHALPDGGGMLDQEYRRIIGMQSAINIHNAMTKLRAATGDDIHKLSHDDRVILKRIYDMGLL